MKNLITIFLCAAMVAMPMQRTKAQLAPAVCLVIIAAVAVGGVAIIVSSCQPKYYCCEDAETKNRWCRIVARNDPEATEFKIISGPYKDASKCNQICTNGPPIAASEPIVELHIEKSTDLQHWTECAKLQVDPTFFEWSETNTVDRACYYRAWTK